MTPLPIDPILPSLVERLGAAGASRCAVLVAPPGAGKSTRVPPALMRAGLLRPEHPNLVMLQPRRVAARSVAARIADEQGWTLGREVGYHIRFDRCLSDRTRLRILTEGVFTRQLIADPFLEGIGAVLLDEFHERHLETDLAIAFLKEIRQTVRPDLLVLVMSATLEAEPVSHFLDDCPIIRAEGRTHPVEIEYASTTPGYRELPEAIARAVQASASNLRDDGHILIFLPGVGEIQRTQRELEAIAARADALLLPLHGALPLDQQRLALASAPDGRRKIILATNIAETSLTIDGVRSVIDGGLARVARYDPQRGLDRLDLERISQASADQRAGRAGRTGPGRAIRLWSAGQQRRLPPFTEPEIQRVDLAGTVLALHAWGSADPRRFGWYESPGEARIAAAEELLGMLGAIRGGSGSTPSASTQITQLGKKMLRLPLHPRLGRLLLAAVQWGLLEEGCAVAALLSEKDILPRGRTTGADALRAAGGESDLLHRLALLEDRSADPDLDRPAVRRVMQVKRQLMRLSHLPSPGTPAEGQGGSSGGEADRSSHLLQALLLAYPDRVCRRRDSDPNTAAIVGGGAVRLAGDSIVRHAECFLALDARHDPSSPTRQASVHLASAIEMEWLEQFFPERMRRESAVFHDPQRDRVVAMSRLYYGDLLLKEQPGAAIDPRQAQAALMTAAEPMAESIIRADPAADQLLNRLEFVRCHTSAAIDLPSLPELLESMSAGKRSIAELKRLDWGAALRGAMDWGDWQQLERLAPAAITLPGGRTWRLNYPVGGERPILAVRLQQLFGLRQTPRIADGRMPLLIHLLAPNGRPVQITDDLESFWKNTYGQVRKDLRARYPKHAWPEIPTAP